MSTVQDKFEDLARTLVEQAEAIDCTFEEFLEGLRTLLDEIRTRLSMAKEEHEHRMAHEERGGESG